MMLTIVWYSLFTADRLAQSWSQLVSCSSGLAGNRRRMAVPARWSRKCFPSRAPRPLDGHLPRFQGAGAWAAWRWDGIVPSPYRGWRWIRGGSGAGAAGDLDLPVAPRAEQWRQAKAARQAGGQRTGRLLDLFAPGLAYKTLVGLALATSAWPPTGRFINGQEIFRLTVKDQYLAQLPATASEAEKRAREASKKHTT